MILRRYKISGHSMEPYLKPDDQVLAVGFLRIKKGDVVVFKYSSKYLVKRVLKIKNDEIFVQGDNKKDSLPISSIKKDAIMGKVLFKL
jgi:phage repressor protein C with HTH and peptisase S24 domain